MAYGKKYSGKKKTKYSKAENIAFRLGQERRVVNSLKSGNKDTRVYEAYCKGLQGKPNNRIKKPLFGD